MLKSPSSRQRLSSSTMASSRIPVAYVLRQPRVLAGLLNYIQWPALHALLSASREYRGLFSDPALRQLILVRFVPGYEACRDPYSSQASPLTIDFHHLHLFSVSQSVPVHTYPTHALRSLFTLPPVNEPEPLAALSQAHSRFVLLLQSLVHSSHNLMIPPEPQHVLLLEKLSPSIPELTSPAPLSYKAPPLPPPPSISRPPLSKPKLKLLSGSTRRLSKNIFKTLPSRPPPPPVAEPPALRCYSSTWKRSVPYQYPSEAYSHSDSENDLVPPRRRYVGSTSTSSNSRSSLSRSSTPTPPTSNSSPSPPPSRSRFPLSPLSTPTPHDFIHAMSPSRAPVLRTYVPCTAPSQQPETTIRCEEQLIDADLWAHLSVGDIVANLGHVPLSSEPEKPATQVSSETRHASLNPSAFASPPGPPAANWLLFNGSILVPFTSSRGAPVPVPDALTLPSPFYYSHILPRLANPVFALRRMPRFSTASPSPRSKTHGKAMEPEEIDIAMRLVHLPARVQTVNGGAAVVRRYKWLARVFVDSHQDPSNEPELGLGWQGEWILEGDGTMEGREVLLDYLVGRGRMQGRVNGKGKERQPQDEAVWEWELVRERCRKGRIWFK
ncbi:hypothetical protein H0H87_008820 [Tephrocybe sp. NHM501043]|nr:hypothetical protein H0H87_008820 [Tephrocybe sp. NHM501043]